LRILVRGSRETIPMNMTANIEALKKRLAGEAAGRWRAAAMAGAAGAGVAAAVYKAMRKPASSGS
jgi:hypothetical protein